MKKKIVLTAFLCGLAILSAGACSVPGSQAANTAQDTSVVQVEDVQVSSEIDPTENSPADAAEPEATSGTADKEYEELEQRLIETYEPFQDEDKAGGLKICLRSFYESNCLRNEPLYSDETYMALLDTRIEVGDWCKEAPHQEAVIFGKESADARRITLEDVNTIIAEVVALSSDESERQEAIFQRMNSIRSADWSYTVACNSLPKYGYYLDDEHSEQIILCLGDYYSGPYIQVAYEHKNEEGIKVYDNLYETSFEHLRNAVD